MGDCRETTSYLTLPASAEIEKRLSVTDQSLRRPQDLLDAAGDFEDFALYGMLIAPAAKCYPERQDNHCSQQQARIILILKRFVVPGPASSLLD